MSKFEEYDLYGKNKDFLVSDGVITFTDTNGKLMALKPDVTLSIIKNTKDRPERLKKICYDENVYRISKESGSFKEILQAGLECIGDIDDCCMGEVLLLAAKSLGACSENYALEISHLGILSAFVSSVTDRSQVAEQIVKCFSEKNLHGISAICRDNGIEEAKVKPLQDLLSLYGAPEKVLPKLEQLSQGMGIEKELGELKSAVSVFEEQGKGQAIQIDFSAVADMNYYNGIIFKGYIKGLPQSVLSGGRYDGLMQKLGRNSGAVGFAVYLDLLDLLPMARTEYDVDVMLLYGDDTLPSELQKAVSQLIEEGKSVYCCKGVNQKLKYKCLMRFEKGEVHILEDHA